jgi:glycosyltransferase involved in cell wall biosynthesis
MSRLAYVMGTFPALTETFVVREIQALEAAGVTVDLYSLRRPARAPAPADGAELASRTVYGSVLPARELWAASARALRRAPARYLAALGAVVAGTALNPVHCLKSLGVFALAVAFAERMRERQAAHVHAHWATYPATAAYVVSRLLGVTYSFTAHAYDASLIRSLMREKIRRAAFVMTCTRSNQAWLRRFAPAARERIILNYHGVVLDRFVPGPEDSRGDPGRFTIVSCGSLFPRKGFPHLLEACRLLRDRGRPVDCLIVGDGPMRAELQRFIDRHGLGDRVHLVGAVSPGEVIRYYRRADLFALACRTDYLGWQEILTDPLLFLEVGVAIPFRPLTDGIPNVLLEAMAMGIPVVSTRVAGIPELVQDGQTGCLVREQDPAALADVIDELRRDPARRRALGRAGRAIVQEKFDRSRSIHELVEIFAARCGARDSPQMGAAWRAMRSHAARRPCPRARAGSSCPERRSDEHTWVIAGRGAAAVRLSHP